MKVRDKLFELFAPPDVREYLDTKIDKRTKRLEVVAEQHARLERLQKMIDVKTGNNHGH